MDPYENLLDKNPYDDGNKRAVTGEIVVVLDVMYDDRGLEFITPMSRALPRGEIHELILTDEPNPREHMGVDRGAVVGFVEIAQGGVTAVGDEVSVGERSLGTLVGFDETHMPNHQNIVLSTDDCRSGADLDIELGTQIRFE
ncbi:DUF6917 domain-containing protein [Halorussus salinisoli]|uniref:DUF6917 domain-containing protein n=1 Tax=Halorussus salinisoli TaxID=2558242 RepID=UPI0010C18A2C|nr:hypothetical protein [Halorussus salinisoli]